MNAGNTPVMFILVWEKKFENKHEANILIQRADSEKRGAEKIFKLTWR